MADSLYLSLWFPGFDNESMLARTAAVMRQFPWSTAQPGVHYVSIQPVDWTQSSLFERRFTPAAVPEEAMDAVKEFALSDYALTFEAYWDLWTPEGEGGQWAKKPEKVLFTAQGTEFDEGTYTETGHIQIDFGLDYPFLHEEINLSPEGTAGVRANVAKLVDFTRKIEEHCNLTGRVLWSESEENLAQKLIARLQQVQ